MRIYRVMAIVTYNIATGKENHTKRAELLFLSAKINDSVWTRRRGEKSYVLVSCFGYGNCTWKLLNAGNNNNSRKITKKREDKKACQEGIMKRNRKKETRYPE